MPRATRRPAAYTFTDVPPANPFFGFIEAAAHGAIVSGYACGGPGEPCDAANRPYFRPYADVTRGQLAKIVVGGGRLGVGRARRRRPSPMCRPATRSTPTSRRPPRMA